MIHSMTGYGRGEYSGAKGSIRAEIKTINHRFFEMSVKLPEKLSVFEDRVREHLQKRIKRGRVHVNIACRGGLAADEKMLVNRELAAAVVRELKALRKELRLSGDIDINTVLTLPGILEYEPPSSHSKRIWHDLKEALDRAVCALLRSRAKEGKALAGDLRFRINRIGGHLGLIERRSGISVTRYKKGLSKRVKELSGGMTIDTGRLEQEVALFAKNSDITEEIIRLKSHVDGFRKALRDGGEKGKTLDFIAQELSREANTIGAKSSDIRISRYVITVKSEIDKIREQLKNIE